MVNEVKLNEIMRDLRRMIIDMDESIIEQNIRDALVYLDCARANLEADGKGVYRVRPEFVRSYS
jgi:hypothetical protein